MAAERSRIRARIAALGCRAHTGWAAIVVVAGGAARPEVVLRCRAELADPSGQVRKNPYHAARRLELAPAAELIASAGRIAAEQAVAALDGAVHQANENDVAVRSCAVVVGAPARDLPLESILRSHALVHAAEGRLYQQALLEAAETLGLDAVAVPRQSIWEHGEAALGIAEDGLRRRLAAIRGDLGPPWAEDQKLAALAAWIATAGPPEH